jgi:riboflavin biosynthesis pyrimidine reductase
VWSLFEADLVDEVLVTLVPFVVGGRDALTMVEGPGFTPERVKRLTLISSEPVGDEVFLTYRVRR